MEEPRTDPANSSPDWSSAAGNAWVGVQDLTDSVYEPFERLLTDEAARGPANRVLDVGCGTGVTTIAIARRLGPGAECTGVDVSEPMIEAARRRAEQAGLDVRFELANAQTHRFETGTFDLVVSRWGVMFFGDPVAAFANLREAARGGQLRSITWRSYVENPFMTVAEEAAAPLLEGFKPRRADEAPGQFGLADEKSTTEILESAGWREVELQPVDVTCRFPESELIRYFTGLGPLARHLDGLPESRIPADLVTTVRDAFSPYIRDGEVRFNAACWMIRANS